MTCWKRRLFLLFQQVTDFGEQHFLLRRSGRCCGSFSLLFLGQLVDGLDKQEYAEGDDDEVDKRLNEAAIVDGGGLHLDTVGNLLGGQRDFQVGEVHSADKPADGGHDDVVNNGRYDLPECSADDDTNSHVDRVALNGKVFEFLNEFAHKSICLSYFNNVMFPLFKAEFQCLLQYRLANHVARDA